MKNCGRETAFLLGRPIFRSHVSLRDGYLSHFILSKNTLNNTKPDLAFCCLFPPSAPLLVVPSICLALCFFKRPSSCKCSEPWCHDGWSQDHEDNSQRSTTSVMFNNRLHIVGNESISQVPKCFETKGSVASQEGIETLPFLKVSSNQP